MRVGWSQWRAVGRSLVGRGSGAAAQPCPARDATRPAAPQPSVARHPATIERIACTGRDGSRIWLPQLTEAARTQLGLPSALEWDALFHLAYRLSSHGEPLRLQGAPQPRVAALLRLLRRLHPDQSRLVEHGTGCVIRNLVAAAEAGFTDLFAVESRDTDRSYLERTLPTADVLPDTCSLTAMDPDDYDERPAAARDTAVSIWTHPAIQCALDGSEYPYLGPYMRRHVLPGGDVLLQTDLPEMVWAVVHGAFPLQRPRWWQRSRPEPLEWVVVHTARDPVLGSPYAERGVWVIWLRRLAEPTVFLPV
ncbi:MAG: hypothetical protein HY696_02315 [Deltaproteobacteria bacterium]|nr:hypothetical protein [Deltaproteobacteria bacterium]